MSAPTDGYTLYNAENECIGSGTGRPELQPGEYFVYSSDPANEPDALAAVATVDALESAMNVEHWKTAEEYAGKAENAIRWLLNNPPTVGDAPLIDPALATADVLLAHTHGDYTAERYIWMFIVVDSRNCTPRECAESIMSAIKRTNEADMGSWEKARLREQLKATSAA